MIDPIEFGKHLGGLIRDALRPLTERLAVLEQRTPERGEKGDRGDPGASVTVDAIRGLLEAETARWALDFERRAQGILERAIDRIPAPKNGKDGDKGKDGTDGLGFDDMTVEHDGERGFVLRFVRGDRTKEFAFTVPAVIDRGFWKEGLAVAKGDGLTCAGSYWIAQKDTDTKPDIGNPDWRLAVKKGRDGKDGDKGERGPQGDKGLPGLNGRNLA